MKHALALAAITFTVVAVSACQGQPANTPARVVVSYVPAPGPTKYIVCGPTDWESLNSNCPAPGSLDNPGTFTP